MQPDETQSEETQAETPEETQTEDKQPVSPQAETPPQPKTKLSSAEVKAAVKEIAGKLNETEPSPIRQIEQIIRFMGVDFAKQLLDETMKIESKGGMKTHNGERRRTPGGVFFYIVKGKLDPEVRQQIFPSFGQNKRGKVISWEERLEHAKPLQENPGSTRILTVTLQGRPEAVTVIEDSIVLTMMHDHSVAVTYPRGVPDPPKTPQIYTVYIGSKHWEKVKERLESNPKDEIIIEGTLVYDAEVGGMAVFSTMVTTREIEREARRSEQDQQPGNKAAAKDGTDKKAAKGKQKTRDKGSKPPKGGKPDNKKGRGPVRAEPPPKVEVDIDVPSNAPPEVVEKLQQLHNAAATLRERAAAKEARGQKAALEHKLLKNTEAQIQALEKQYS